MGTGEQPPPKQERRGSEQYAEPPIEMPEAGSAESQSSDEKTENLVTRKDTHQKKQNEQGALVEKDSWTTLEWSTMALVAATLSLVYVTWRQHKTAKEQLKLTDRQLVLREKQFLTVHRPCFELRSISFLESERTGKISDATELHKLIERGRKHGYFRVVNVGDNWGCPIRGYMCFRTAASEDMALKNLPIVSLDNTKVRVGESLDVKICWEEWDVNWTHSICNGFTNAYLIGAIMYEDPLRGFRTTAFSRRYDLDTNTFIPTENSQHDYAE